MDAMPNVAPLHPGDPQVLGGFRLTGRVGEGGQGIVYLGEDVESGDRVAVKVLHGTLWGDDDARDRFMREAELAMQVASFCTARILSAGMIDDRPYIVTEYIDGPCLKRRVATGGVLTEGALERLAIGTATALTAIHQAGIVHRDLKPANVLLGPDGPRVIDFGIALYFPDQPTPPTSSALDGTLTATNHVVGTPAYMAPERFSGARVGPAADVFSWGATIAFAATGRAPFGTDSIPAVLNRVVNESADLTGLRGPLRDLVEQCLDKDPARRPTAQQVLLGLLGGDPASAMTVTAPAASTVVTPLLTAATDMAAGLSADTRAVGTTRRSLPSLSRSKQVLLPAAAAAVVAIASTAALAAARPASDPQNMARTGPVSGAPEVGAPAGTSGSPAAGSAASQTGTPVRVPDLAGLDKSAAAGKVRAAHLAVGKTTKDCSAGHPGKVVRTWPTAGSAMPPQTVVSIVMAASKARVLDGKGWPVSQARKVLEKDGFQVKLTRKHTGYWHGKVFSQHPAADALACPGSVVTLTIGTA
jgi:hypothetical protein